MNIPPLEGLSVLDFSTLVPGPLASLILAEAGASVVKVERRVSGDEMRTYEPRIAGSSINFHLLTRGKHSIALDLKDTEDREKLIPLIKTADVLIEQFRPGVMRRLGLDFAAVQEMNPRIIYCSLTGWGQTGPKAMKASHDLNFMAETGLLGLSGAADGMPGLPPVLAGDIAGGAYPAVINILLALMQRQTTGRGVYLDMAMADSLFTFAYEALGEGLVAGNWPERSGGLTTGKTPRYRIYRTADDRFIAAAPLEQKFWTNFCRIIELPDAMRDAGPEQAEAVADTAAARIARKSAREWMTAFENEDVCCSLVEDLQAAVADPQILERGLFDRTIQADGAEIPVLPLPVASVFRAPGAMRVAPDLGSGTDQQSVGKRGNG